MASSSAGPFAVGDRVRLRAFDANGEIVAIGETQTIRAQGIDTDPAGEVRQVTFYDVRLDSGAVRTIADRDGHIRRV